MANKQTKMLEAIARHGSKLNAIFNTGIDNVILCKKLRKLEVKARNLTTDACNNGNVDHSAMLERILKIARNTLLAGTDRFTPELRDAIFINTDPRGYAIKIKDDYVRDHNLDIHRDFGGYGIIAPDLSEG